MTPHTLNQSEPLEINLAWQIDFMTEEEIAFEMMEEMRYEADMERRAEREERDND